uniref:Peptidase S1 domain-containing protein n=1 Tax=Romanomermis culicivorax TaxID=13658 RepID=A0A915JYC9_ROMCU
MDEQFLNILHYTQKLKAWRAISEMVSNAVTRLVLFLSIVSALCCYIAQAKPVENDETAERKTYWTIHLLKLKPGAYAYDCDAVLLTPRQNQTVQTSQILLTTSSCVMRTDKKFGKSRIVNEKEISALLVERDSDGQFMNYFEMEVESIQVHEDYRPYTVNYGADVVALIKLKKATNPFLTSADALLSLVWALGEYIPGREWNLTKRRLRLNDPITLVDVETHPYGQRIKAHVFKSEEKSLLRFTLGSPLICRHNGVHVIQALIEEIHYNQGWVILNESNETSYVGGYGTPVKIGPPNTIANFNFCKIYFCENLMKQESTLRSLAQSGAS